MEQYEEEMKNMMKKGLAWAAYGVAGACLWLGIAHANLIKDSVPWWIFHGRGIESTSTNCYIQVGDSGTITAGNATISNLTTTGSVTLPSSVITGGTLSNTTLNGIVNITSVISNCVLSNATLRGSVTIPIGNSGTLQYLKIDSSTGTMWFASGVLTNSN